MVAGLCEVQRARAGMPGADDEWEAALADWDASCAMSAAAGGAASAGSGAAAVGQQPPPPSPRPAKRSRLAAPAGWVTASRLSLRVCCHSAKD